MIDHVADVFAQCLGRRRESLGVGRTRGRQCIEVIAQPGDAELVENSGRENAALGKIADVGQRGRIRGIRQRGRDRVAVSRQQHLRKLAEFRRRRARTTRLGFACRRVRLRAFDSILRRGLFLQLRSAEKNIKTLPERLLFVLAFCKCQQQRVTQDSSVGKTDIGHRFHGIDAFRGRYANAGAASRPEEPMQLFAHQPNTPCRPALATKLVTCGSVVSMSASYFKSTLSVSLTVS